MNREEVVEILRERIRVFVDQETDVTAFSFSLKPSKPLAERGLGISTPNAWSGLLQRFQDVYLPPSAPFRNVEFDRTLSDRIYDMELGDICFELADVLLGN